MRRRAAGNTLLEVFFAMVLLSLTIFAVLSVYPSWSASIRRAHVLSNASTVAMEALETARNTPFYDIGPTTSTRTVDGVDFSVDITVATPSISVAGSITTVTPGAATGISTQPGTAGPLPLEKDVTVTVLWFSGSAPSSLTDTTCVYNFPNPR